MLKVEPLTIHIKKTLRDALIQLNSQPQYLILFVVNDDSKVVGTITDGDIRRGLINNLNNDSVIEEFANKEFIHLSEGEYEKSKLDLIREKQINIVPVLNKSGELVKIVNFNEVKTILPVDAVLMAGGKGTRLRPLTENTPKPLLKIGDKPIIEYNIDRLKKFGVFNQFISINYLGDQLVGYFGSGDEKELNINYIKEESPLGTIGSVKLANTYKNDYILVMNSDILTDLDYELFFAEMEGNDADMIVATTSYKVEIPYGVIETQGNNIVSLVEKPTYTYYSNAGIYLIKKEHLSLIPEGEIFNATDLMEKLIEDGGNVIHYPIPGYWLDIGKPKDFEKAQEDIKHLKF